MNTDVKHLNFSNQDLKGRSFKRQNLTGANFTNADIRSCDFSEAILENASFKGAITGIKPQQKQKLTAIAIALAGVAGVTAALAAGIFFLSVVKSLKDVTAIIVIAVAVTFIITISTKNYGYIALASAVAIIIALAGASVGVFAGAFVGTLAIALILIFGIIGAATGAGIYAVIGNLSILIAGIGSVIGAIIIAIYNNNNVLFGILAFTASGIVEILAGYVANSALKGNERLTFIRNRAIAFSSWGGTSFYKANLAKADFLDSKLEKTDFRFASIFQTNFEGVIGLDYARLYGTILEDLSVQKLCVTLNGQGKDYTDKNLNGACLKSAKMEGSTLVRTQVLGTDFTNASLTGACIQEWNFNSETIFENVDCQRIFLKCANHKSFYEVKPDNGSFEPGHFSKWIQEIKDTVDLIFDKGLNWKAFAFSLAQSAIDNHEGHLSLQSMENKGNGIVVVKIQVPESVNKSKIHKSITDNYNEAVQRLEQNYQLALQAKDDAIIILKQLFEANNNYIGNLFASMNDRIYINGEGNQVYLVNKGGKLMSIDHSNQSRNIDVKGNFNLEQTGSTFNIGDISGAVTNTIQQLKDSNQPDAPKLADLISQLQVAIETDKSLTEEQKKDALEALETIGEEGQKLPENRIQKMCKFAVNSLKALFPIATATGTLATTLSECLPQITQLLGL
jgi:uncharacterized protein YjbI with pentapeptide repeats